CLTYIILSAPSTPALLPYTTLFRSSPITPGRLTDENVRPRGDARQGRGGCGVPAVHNGEAGRILEADDVCLGGVDGVHGIDPQRSEEHTSELQSRFDLVCRLLLEKK